MADIDPNWPPTGSQNAGWTADSTLALADGSYRDGKSVGGWTADGSTDANRPKSSTPYNGPGGFKSFQMSTYTPINNMPVSIPKP